MLLTSVMTLFVSCKHESLSDLPEKVSVSVTIDSCEYLSIFGGGLAHKGNCRFCNERRQQDIEKIIIELKGNGTER